MTADLIPGSTITITRVVDASLNESGVEETYTHTGVVTAAGEWGVMLCYVDDLRPWQGIQNSAFAADPHPRIRQTIRVH